MESPGSANSRRIRTEWPTAAGRVLPSFRRWTTDPGDRRNLRRCLHDLFRSERVSKSRCGDSEPQFAGRNANRGSGFVELASGKQSEIALQRHPEAVATIAAWATSNGYDAAIWTALASNFDQPDKGGEPFSVTAAVRYLEGTEGQDTAKFARALAYIRNAPPEVQTPVREEVAKRWPA